MTVRVKSGYIFTVQNINYKNLKRCFYSSLLILTSVFFFSSQTQTSYAYSETETTLNAASAPLSDAQSRDLEERLGENFILAMAGIFLLGLALNLTPCIYPMLAVTVSVFGKGEVSDKKASSVRRAVVYVLGIATMYSLLGLAASFTGGLFGAFLQSPSVLIGIGLLFLLLALSMFGLFEIRVPSFLTARAVSSNILSYSGIYLSGLFVGVFAAPCIGPPIIALMTLVGHRGDPLFGFLSFFTLSLGLGFPYLILGSFSGLIDRLPRSGEWMLWVRKLIGVILIAFALFYSSLALGPRLIFVLIPLTLISGGIYLGFLDKSRGGRVFVRVKHFTALFAVVAGVGIYFSGRSSSVEWMPWTPSGEAAAYESLRPTIVYFSADWCIPCLEMDMRTFSDRKVIERISEFNLLKVDLTVYDSEESGGIRERFNIAAVPTLVFIDESGREIRSLRRVGYVGRDDMLGHLDKLIDADYDAAEENDLYKGEDESYSEAFFVTLPRWIEPGENFQAGILFQIKDGWHTYWQNPGDSGMAADIEWELPKGFSIGEVIWPYPERFQEGAFYTFGHSDFLLLSSEVQVPEDLTPGDELQFGADVYWLVCKDICYAQEASLRIQVRVRDEPAPYSERWAEYFQRTKALIPASDDFWKFSYKKSGEYIILKTDLPRGVSSKTIEESEFFPLVQGQIRPGNYSWTRRGRAYELIMRKEGIIPLNEYLEGVLVFGRGETPRAIKVKAEAEQKNSL